MVHVGEPTFQENDEMPSRHHLCFVLDWKDCGPWGQILVSTVVMKRNGMNKRRKIFRSFALLFVSVWMLAAWPAVQAQTTNGISEPAEGDTISGVVVITGTAQDPNFLRYEIAFQQVNAANGWISFAQGDQPVIDGTLAVWDTSVGQNVGAPVFPDGPYQLRLRVVRQDFNYDEFFATGIAISNSEPTPTPTADITLTVASQPAVSTLPPSTAVPDVLPTLTPFPTPSPQPTPIAAVDGAGPAGPEAEARLGVFDQIAAVEVNRLRDAFWQGVQIVFLIFGAMAVYIILRGGGRRIWRALMSRFSR